VTRRPPFLIASLVATLTLIIAACSSGTPAAPALTDPKEILTQSVLSLKDVKTAEFVGTFTGKVQAAEMGGSLDLSSTTMAGAIDIPNQKAKFTLDAPSLMSTKVEALLVDGFAYLKIDGILAGMAGLESGKYVKTEVPMESSKPVTDDAEVQKSIDEFKAQLDKLPNPPTKEADEKCGDVDCYHVKIALSAEDLAKLNPEAGSVSGQVGDLTVDLWARKDNLRPAKLGLTVASPEIGTVGATLDFKYDVSVDVQAPPADQVVTPSP
jgi:hypothetical protein